MTANHTLRANMLKIEISPQSEHLQAMQAAFAGADGPQKVTYPIQARLTVIDGGDAAVMLVALDACYMLEADAHRFRERIAQRTGIPAGHVLLCASHSHSAPALAFEGGTGSWTQWVLEALVAASAKAWSGRRPVRVGVGYGYRYGVCFNQRLPQAETQTKFVRDYVEGRTNPRPIDPQIGILRIDEADGRLMGVVMHFAAHPATLINSPEVTPDFPGFMCDYVERRRPGAVAAFLQGACGDINIDYMFTTIGAAEYTGSLLGQEVVRVLDDIPTRERVPMCVSRREHRLPLEPMPTEAEIAAWQKGCDEYLTAAKEDPTRLWVNGLNMTEYVSAKTRASMVGSLRKWCDWIQEHREEIARIRDCRYEQVALYLGELMAIFHPFEPFVEIGLELRRLSPTRHTWLAGYANGCKGYLPTSAEHRRGGYEPVSRRYARDLYDQPLNLAEDAAAIFIANALEDIRKVTA